MGYEIKTEKSKKNNQIIVSMLIFVFTVCTTLLTSVEKVCAAKPTFPKTIEIIRYEKKLFSSETNFYYMNSPTADGKITDISISDEEIATVSECQEDNSAFEVTYNKESKLGTAEITFNYAGKKYTTKLIVKKWENPCKSFKLGKKDYNSKFDISNQYNLNKQKGNKKVKVNITAKKGWKIKSIKFKDKKIKNNSTIVLDNKGEWGTGSALVVEFQNKETKECVCLIYGYSNFNYPSGNFYNSTVSTY